MSGKAERTAEVEFRGSPQPEAMAVCRPYPHCNVAKMKQTQLSGRCACGQVVFQAMAETACAVCYCETCRRASGSWGMAWVDAIRSSLSIHGPVSRWRSSSHAYRHFCGVCGTQLLLLEDEGEDVIEIAVGSLDPQHLISVDHESYLASRPEWTAALKT